MQFPLSIYDLSLWLGTTAMILLITSELLSSNYGRSNLIIEKKRLKRAALTLGILFMITVFIRLYETLLAH